MNEPTYWYCRHHCGKTWQYGYDNHFQKQNKKINTVPTTGSHKINDSCGECPLRALRVNSMNHCERGHWLMHCSQTETTNDRTDMTDMTERTDKFKLIVCCEWNNEVETKENPQNSLNCLFSFNYNAVMSTEMNKQTHKNAGRAVFLLLRAPLGAADVSVSHCCN